MIAVKSFLVCVVVLALVSATCHGAAFSLACVTDANGKMVCTENSDPNAQSSSSYSSSGGQAMTGTWRGGLPYGFPLYY